MAPTQRNVSREACRSREQVLADVVRIACEFTEAAPEHIRETSTLEVDLGFDSLDVMEFLMEVEEHFGLDVPEDAPDRIRTIGDAVNGVLQLLGEDQANEPAG